MRKKAGWSAIDGDEFCRAGVGLVLVMLQKIKIQKNGKQKDLTHGKILSEATGSNYETINNRLNEIKIIPR